MNGDPLLLSPSAGDPITRLMSEHRLIERMLDALDRWATDLTIGAPTPATAPLLGFFSDFADRLHHHKEEQILFTTMVEFGLPRHAGPIAVMEREHELGRAHIAAMLELTSRELDAERRNTVLTHAREFSSLLRAHIRKEDQVLYPMARQILGDAMSSVQSRCASFDLEHTAEVDGHVTLVASLL